MVHSQPPKPSVEINPYDAAEVKSVEFPHGFQRFKEKDKYDKLHHLVSEIKSKALLPTTTADAGEVTGGEVNDLNNVSKTISTDPQVTEVYKRQIEMLVTDVEYINDHVDKLEKSPNGKRAEVLLQHLMDAVDRRKANDFERNSVNLKKLLQIVSKLKLWVPPQRKTDRSESEITMKKKKEESPFVSSKERENAAIDIVKELVALRCGQWGMDGLLKAYDELTDIVKNCLLCFSVFQCDVGKDKENRVSIQKSLEIKKRILIYWWVAEGLIDLYARGNHAPDPISELNSQVTPNPNSAPNTNPNLNPISELNSQVTPNPNSTPNTNPNPDQNQNLQGDSNSNPIPNSNVASHINEQIPQSEVKKTVEEIGEEILSVLVEKGFIEPVMKKSTKSASYLMHPFVHSFISALAKRAGFFDFSETDGKILPRFGLSQRACLVKPQDKLSSCQLWATYTDDRNKLKRFGVVQTLFNVNESIIDIKPEWFSKMKNLHVLHLGSWRSDAVEHIEVEDQKFLEDLIIMKQLKLFSLQGVSTIMTLPNSICELTNLIILDLRECHNLEELPAKIGDLKSLTHLDITNCHLLTKLPKSIRLLSKLEVLKGFVIYEQASDRTEKACIVYQWWKKCKGCVVHEVFRCKNREVCSLKDLERLEDLRELSIVVNREDFPTVEEVQVLEKMKKLHKLKISWEQSFEDKSSKTKKQEDSKALFTKCGCSCFSGTGEQEASSEETEEPKPEILLEQIQKLELWCFPKKMAPDWWLHPTKLGNLQKLYIKGGNLTQIPGHGDKWESIKTLRLKYLPEIKIPWLDLKMMFPKMRYLEKYDCKKLEFFPCDQEGVWINWDE